MHLLHYTFTDVDRYHHSQLSKCIGILVVQHILCEVILHSEYFHQSRVVRNLTLINIIMSANSGSSSYALASSALRNSKAVSRDSTASTSTTLDRIHDKALELCFPLRCLMLKSNSWTIIAYLANLAEGLALFNSDVQAE